MRNNSGFTLVEEMVALLILLFVMLALMQTAMVSIDSNIINALRQEAAGIAQTTMNTSLSSNRINLVSQTYPFPSHLRNFSNFSYTVTQNVTFVGTNNAQVVVTVAWTWKGKNYSDTVSTIVPL